MSTPTLSRTASADVAVDYASLHQFRSIEIKDPRFKDKYAAFIGVGETHDANTLYICLHGRSGGGPDNVDDLENFTEFLETELVKLNLFKLEDFDQLIIFGDFNMPLATADQREVPVVSASRQRLENSLATRFNSHKITLYYPTEVRTRKRDPRALENSQFFKNEGETSNEVVAGAFIQRGKQPALTIASGSSMLTRDGSSREFQFSIKTPREGEVGTTMDHCCVCIPIPSAQDSRKYRLVVAANIIASQGRGGIRRNPSTFTGEERDRLSRELEAIIVKEAILMSQRVTARLPNQPLLTTDTLKTHNWQFNKDDLRIFQEEVGEFHRQVLTSAPYQEVVTNIKQNLKTTQRTDDTKALALQTGRSKQQIWPYDSHGKDPSDLDKMTGRLWDNLCLICGAGESKSFTLNNMVNDAVNSLGMQLGGGYKVSNELLELMGETSDMEEIAAQIYLAQKLELDQQIEGQKRSFIASGFQFTEEDPIIFGIEVEKNHFFRDAKPAKSLFLPASQSPKQLLYTGRYGKIVESTV